MQLSRSRRPARKAKAVSIYEFEGLARNQVTESTAGNIIAMSGIPDITIGDTICAPDRRGAPALCEDQRPPPWR